MNTRNPKPRKFTDEQEREIEAAEGIMFRARIYERGIGAVLGQEFTSDAEYAIAAQVLAEAVQLRRDAREIQERTRRAADDPTPRRQSSAWLPRKRRNTA